MTSQGKTWDRLKAEYLHRVEKALSSVKHPRSRDVLDDVRSHLDRRFAELDPAQRNYKNLQAIITEMGPASDYAELLAPNATATPTQKVQRKYLLWLALSIAALAIVVAILAMTIFSQPEPVTPEQFRRNLSKSIEHFNIDAAALKDVVKTFGEPSEYIWGNQTFDRKNLPRRCVVVYPDGFHIFVSDNKIVELRHEGPGTGYAFLGKLKVGATLNEVIEVLGEPKETVVGEKNWFTEPFCIRISKEERDTATMPGRTAMFVYGLLITSCGPST